MAGPFWGGATGAFPLVPPPVSVGVAAIVLSYSSLSHEAIGLRALIVRTPMTKAMIAAGSTKRQADTPAARMAISSLRRLSVTKARIDPPRKANGSRIRIVDGAFSSTRPMMPRPLMSVRAAMEREIST